MDDSFFTAFFPGSAKVCGRTLSVFSSYHYLILRAINSPFLGTDGEITAGDLLVAVRVCGKRFGDAPTISPNFRDVWWKLRMTRNHGLFSSECRKFAAWLSANSSGPNFWEVVNDAQPTRDLTGPDILTLLVPIMMKTSSSQAEIWNMGFGMIKWISAEIAEIDGCERRFLYDSDFEEETEEGDA